MKVKRIIKQTVVMAFVCMLALCMMPHQAEAAVTRPAKTVLSSVSTDSLGTITVKIKKTKYASGYQVFLSKDKNYKSGKITYNTTNITSKTSKPETGMYYYIKAGAYKRVGKKTYYGSWSNTKSVFVKPGKAEITTLKSNNPGSATITFKKKAGSVSGYQIRYSLNKNFSGAKTIAQTGLSKTISGLTQGKTYYFSVRQYKKTGKTTYYGSWSNTKCVSIKKKAVTPVVNPTPTPAPTPDPTPLPDPVPTPTPDEETKPATTTDTQPEIKTESEEDQNEQNTETTKENNKEDDSPMTDDKTDDSSTVTTPGESNDTINDEPISTTEPNAPSDNPEQKTGENPVNTDDDDQNEKPGLNTSIDETPVEEHEHSWQPVYSEKQVYVVDKEAWDEQIYKSKLVCLVCGEEFSDSEEAVEHSVEFAHRYGSKMTYETLHHNEQGHYETIRELTGYQCSCGETKAHTHEWEPQYANKSVWVTDKDAYDETVATEHYYCFDCDKDYTDTEEAMKHFDETYHMYSHYNTLETIRHDEQGHYETESYVSGYKCSCGATK